MALPFDYLREVFKIEEIKDFQRNTLTALLSGHDVFLSVKTGSGKSICFHGFVPLWNKTCDNQTGTEAACTVLVISPLLSIMREQCDFLNSLGFSSTYIGKYADEDDDILSQKFQFLFSSPESVLSKGKWRDMLTMPNSIRLIAVDEAHTVLRWGDCQQGDDKPFREWYGKLGEIRSLLHCPLLVLTATANQAARRDLQKRLCMVDCVEIIGNPDRNNIMLFVQELRSSTQPSDALFFLTQCLREKKDKCEWYLIFCVSIKMCSDLYTMFTIEVGDDMKYVQMFHSKTPDEVKDMIKTDMGKDEGAVRVLIATSAAGMGVNYSGVHNVVHFGAPRDMDSYVQQYGRAGRDGVFSMAMLFYYKRQFRFIGSDMKSFISNTNNCRRENLLAAYKCKPKEDRDKDTCCDICASKCKEKPQKVHPYYNITFPDTSGSESADSDDYELQAEDDHQ